LKFLSQDAKQQFKLIQTQGCNYKRSTYPVIVAR
jgi:hypothetical protein